MGIKTAAMEQNDSMDGAFEPRLEDYRLLIGAGNFQHDDATAGPVAIEVQLKNIQRGGNLILATTRDPEMSEKRGRGQPKFEPTPDQRSQVKLMKAVGIPEDRICKTITNPRTGKPVAPMTLARAFAAELESGATEFHAHVGNFILCAILGKKPALGDAIKSEQVRMTAAI